MDGFGPTRSAAALRSATVAPSSPTVVAERKLPLVAMNANSTPENFSLPDNVTSFSTSPRSVDLKGSDSFVTQETSDLAPVANTNTSAAFMQDNGPGGLNDPNRRADVLVLNTEDLKHRAVSGLSDDQEREKQRLEALEKQNQMLDDDGEDDDGEDNQDNDLTSGLAKTNMHRAEVAAGAAAMWFNRHRFNPMMMALRAAYRKIFGRGAAVAEAAALRVGEEKLAGGIVRRTAARMVEREAVNKAARVATRVGARVLVGEALGSTVIGGLLGFGALNAWNPLGWGSLAIAGLALGGEIAVRYAAQRGEKSWGRAAGDMGTAWGNSFKNVGLGLVEMVTHPVTAFQNTWSDMKNISGTGIADMLTGGYYSTAVATWTLWQWGKAHPENMDAIKKLTTDVWNDGELAMKVVTAGAAGALSAQANQDVRAGAMTAFQTARQDGALDMARANQGVKQDIKKLYHLSVDGKGGWHSNTGSLPSPDGQHVDPNATLQQPRPTAGRKPAHPGYEGLAAISPMGAPHAPSPANSNGIVDPRLQNDA